MRQAQRAARVLFDRGDRGDQARRTPSAQRPPRILRVLCGKIEPRRACGFEIDKMQYICQSASMNRARPGLQNANHAASATATVKYGDLRWNPAGGPAAGATHRRG